MSCLGMKPVPRCWVWWVTPVIPILLKAEAGGLKTILDYRSPCLKTQKQQRAKEPKKKALCGNVATWLVPLCYPTSM